MGAILSSVLGTHRNRDEFPVARSCDLLPLDPQFDQLQWSSQSPLHAPPSEGALVAVYCGTLRRRETMRGLATTLHDMDPGYGELVRLTVSRLSGRCL